MADIQGYTFDADVHCVGCTIERFGFKGDAKSNGYFTYGSTATDGTELDENLIPVHQTDSEGNEIHPFWSWQMEDDEYCGDCHGKL